jgi:hypothetical protein
MLFSNFLLCLILLSGHCAGYEWTKLPIIFNSRTEYWEAENKALQGEVYSCEGILLLHNAGLGLSLIYSSFLVLGSVFLFFHLFIVHMTSANIIGLNLILLVLNIF